ncbi:MAG: hypothetical protein GW893_01705 [Armatimonadetes bacterium]|nr:hypothetical protein [Armatimonadota bacterium]
MSVTLTLTNKQIGALRKVVHSHNGDDDSEEVRTLQELLEDLEDLRDARISEAEYARGKGRPFEDYLRERRQRAASV